MRAMRNACALPAALIPILASLLGVGSITVPYIVAVARGDQKWGLHNLPDITHCVLDMPERGIFYVLFMPGIALQATSWMLAWPASRVASVFGVIACCLLVLGEAMLDPHPYWGPHIFGASGFFLVSMIAVVIRSWGSKGEDPRSLHLKRCLAVLNVALVLCDTAFGGVNAPGWADHLMEWCLAWTSLLFVATFASDLRGACITLSLPGGGAIRAEGLLNEAGDEVRNPTLGV